MQNLIGTGWDVVVLLVAFPWLSFIYQNKINKTRPQKLFLILLDYTIALLGLPPLLQTSIV